MKRVAYVAMVHALVWRTATTFQFMGISRVERATSHLRAETSDKGNARLAKQNAIRDVVCEFVIGKEYKQQLFII